MTAVPVVTRWEFIKFIYAPEMLSTNEIARATAQYGFHGEQKMEELASIVGALVHLGMTFQILTAVISPSIVRRFDCSHKNAHRPKPIRSFNHHQQQCILIVLA